jgi:hypothetical protein
LVPGGVPLPHNDGGVPSPWNSPSAPQSPHSPSPRASPITFPPLEEDATAPPVPSTVARDGAPLRPARSRPAVDYFKKQPNKREWGPKWLDAVGADPKISGPLATVPEETSSPPPAPLPPSPSIPASPHSAVDYSPGGTHEFGSSYTPFVAADLPEPLTPLPPSAALQLELTVPERRCTHTCALTST